jgi:hypothetical protein
MTRFAAAAGRPGMAYAHSIARGRAVSAPIPADGLMRLPLAPYQRRNDLRDSGRATLGCR